MKIEQGDILKVSRQSYPVIVASNNFFNETGKAVVCPVRKDVQPGPLYLPLVHDAVDGFVLCEQVHYFDLKQRNFSKIGSMSHFDIMDFSDAVMGIFDCQTIWNAYNDGQFTVMKISGKSWRFQDSTERRLKKAVSSAMLVRKGDKVCRPQGGSKSEFNGEISP